MALCKNRRCMEPLRNFYWGDGYCSKRCFETSEEYAPETHDGMPHPDDRSAMEAALYQDAELFDAITQAAALDARLPRIIYLRRKGKTLREVAGEIGCNEKTVRNLLSKSAPNILTACGLRKTS